MSGVYPLTQSETMPSGAIIERLRRDGMDTALSFVGPFGPRRLLYADYTASGRSVGLIEQAIAAHAMPFYGNTHTEASHTGRHTTQLREAARQAIRQAVHGDERHAVIFCGSGATAAINKLVAMLGLALPTGARERDIVRAATPESERAVVFVGPYEHHSNDLPWRESLASVVRLPLDASGRPCLQTLDRLLQQYADRPRRIVALSAASNVTGVKTDIAASARLVHAHGGLCVVDYAAGAPYLPIDMNGAEGAHLDAVFLSPHKFVGGPGASGVLVVERKLHLSGAPTASGGGTVRFVTPAAHRYLSDIEHLEEAGTPAILGDIRAGLAFQLKADIGTDAIHAAEQRAIARARHCWNDLPQIEILGPSDTERLAIFSFNIRSGNRMLHHGFVVSLLNDLFGLQARGGCSCAGPYGHDLLGIDDPLSAQYQAVVEEGWELYKPGWVRIGFNYTFDDATMDAVIDAIAFVARRGRDLLSLYEVDPRTGRWQAKAASAPASNGFADLCAGWRGDDQRSPAVEPAPDFAACLTMAERLADDARHAQSNAPDVSAANEHLRWFWFPGEAA